MVVMLGQGGTSTEVPVLLHGSSGTRHGCEKVCPCHQGGSVGTVQAFNLVRLHWKVTKGQIGMTKPPYGHTRLGRPVIRPDDDTTCQCRGTAGAVPPDVTAGIWQVYKHVYLHYHVAMV